MILASGSYPFLNVNGLNGIPQAWITITGPATGPPARIFANSTCCNTVQITNSSYVAITNLTVDSQSLAYIDGINAHDDISNLTHDILIEGNTLTGQDANQQTCGISTKTPTWGWIIRNNVINGAGTGVYLGNSDGSDPFVGGILEDNLIENTIGYDTEIKFQNPRPTVTGMPTGQSFTIIRNNVFIKNDQVSSGWRPAQSAGRIFSRQWPWYHRHVRDLWQFLLPQSPRGTAAGRRARVSIHDNVFVDGIPLLPSIWKWIDGNLQIACLYNNTVYSPTYGFYFGAPITVDGSITGNLILAATPISGSVPTSNNITDTLANAASYVTAPSLALGSMNFFPLPGHVTGAPLDLSKFTGDVDYSIDFNGNPKGVPAVFRGAYAGAGPNPGWPLQAAVKPTGTTPPAALGSIVCAPATVVSGSSSVCTVTLASAANGSVAVSLGSSGGSLLIVPPSVTVPNGATSVSFPASAGRVALLTAEFRHRYPGWRISVSAVDHQSPTWRGSDPLRHVHADHDRFQC